MVVKTEKELGKAVNEEQDTIEIEGDLSKKVFKIKATGKVAWGVCLGALTVAIIATVAALVPDPAEPIEVGAAIVGTGLAGVTLGTAAPVAVSIGIAGAIAAGATGTAVVSAAIAILKKLRKYKIVEKTKDRLVLKRK